MYSIKRMIATHLKSVILGLLAILYIHDSCFSQITVSGQIADSMGGPIPSLTVTLVKIDGSVSAFAVTDSTGRYRIYSRAFYTTDSFFVSTNGLAYRNQRKSVLAAAITIDFILERRDSILPDVSVVSTTPLIKQKKDTIEYDVAGFSGKKDRVIGDVIRKLPGIEIDGDGKILFQGKEISKLYIDGDNLLSGNYNIATNNIPVDFVSKVQVLENFQEIKAIRKIDRVDQAALNLVLSAKAKIKLLGIGDVAIGVPALYDANIQSQLFKKNFKSISFFKTNNVGNDLQQARRFRLQARILLSTIKEICLIRPIWVL